MLVYMIITVMGRAGTKIRNIIKNEGRTISFSGIVDLSSKVATIHNPLDELDEYIYCV